MHFVLMKDGGLLDSQGCPVALPVVESFQVRVPHLCPYVLNFQMPRGDVIGLKVQFSCHCWTEGYDPALHTPKHQLIMDGNRARVFSRARYESSLNLRELLGALSSCTMYWTASDRNYGVYNATLIIDGLAYTAFFTLAKERGRFDGNRYHLVMGVESAYFAPQPSKGLKVRAAAAIDAALNNRKFRYR